MNTRILLKVVFFIWIGIFSISGLVSADTSKLIGSLTDLLGVSGEQATGGAGAVFREAKKNMDPGDYSKLLSAIPGIDSLIQAAPQVSGLAGKASSLFGAPSLPLDGNFPFLHLDRKFMHLGFHIFDVGFQSPNVEAARPLVYATALLLVVVIVILNLVAITVRNRLREKYRALEH